VDDPEDWVRIEIGEALSRDGIQVVPVLLDDTPMPRIDQLPDELKTLVYRNAEKVKQLTFDTDVARLIRRLGLKPQEEDRRRTPFPGGIPERYRLNRGPFTDEDRSKFAFSTFTTMQPGFTVRLVELERAKRGRKIKAFTVGIETFIAEVLDDGQTRARCEIGFRSDNVITYSGSNGSRGALTLNEVDGQLVFSASQEFTDFEAKDLDLQRLSREGAIDCLWRRFLSELERSSVPTPLILLHPSLRPSWNFRISDLVQGKGQKKRQDDKDRDKE
jgi:hypothetical protein